MAEVGLGAVNTRNKVRVQVATRKIKDKEGKEKDQWDTRGREEKKRGNT